MADKGNKGKDDDSKKDLSVKKKTKKERKLVDYDSSDEDVKNTKESKPKIFDVDPAKDYFCNLCRAQMNSDLTWNTHINGKRHIKKVQASNFATQRRTMPSDASGGQQVSGSGGLFIPVQDSNEIAHIQSYFDGEAKDPIVGLDFIKEIWLSEQTSEPAYHCSLCEAPCQRITIGDHVIGYRHRMNYLKLKNPDRYAALSIASLKKSYVSKELAKETYTMEKRYGRGFVKVAYQTDDTPYNFDDFNVKDMDVDDRGEASDDSDEDETPPTPPPEPAPRRKEKPLEISVEDRVKQISPAVIRQKFDALPHSERLRILNKIKILPYARYEDREKDVAQLRAMTDICVQYMIKSGKYKEYVNDALAGRFECMNVLNEKLFGASYFKEDS